MNVSLSERRQIENEMIFRRANERIGDGLDTLDAMHIEDDDIHLINNDDILLHFKCECSDEDCEARIQLKLSTYQGIHENRDAFVIKLEHQDRAIEKVILTESTYCVVEKNKTVPEPANALNITSVNNT